MKQVPPESTRRILMRDGDQTIYHAHGPRRNGGVVDNFKFWADPYAIRDEELLAYFKKSQINSGVDLFPLVLKFAEKTGKQLQNGELDPDRFPPVSKTGVTKDRWGLLIAKMISEENKSGTILGKNIVIFSMYRVLREGSCPVTLASDVKLMSAAKIKAFCKKKNIWVAIGTEEESYADDPTLEC